MEDLNIKQFQEMNRKRSASWHNGIEWSLSDWAVAMAGECGEACNVVKKLNRVRDGLPEGRVKRSFMTDEYQAETRKYLTDCLAEEIADTMMYCFLLADAAGIDVQTALLEKYYEVSRSIGYEGDENE